jgi:CRP-like cAMP-binding protein
MEFTVLRSLYASDLERLLDSSPQLARNLLRILSGQLRHTSEYVQHLAFLDVNGRVAARLLAAAGGHGAEAGAAEIELDLTQKELATWVAASRESVNKALQTFRDQGLIDLRRGTITVLDRRGLEDRVQH